MKECCIPISVLKPHNAEDCKYVRINGSSLARLSRTTANIRLNNFEREIEICIVLDKTMYNLIVLSRGALEKLNLGLNSLRLEEATTTNNKESFNINIEFNNIANSLQVN